jgi:predicted HTH transcriptional regulator
MDLRELKRLAYEGEGAFVEFKRKVKHPEKIVRELVAFANSDGGHLLIGVNDNGEIPGLKFPEEEEYLMQKAIRELCRPRLFYEMEIIPLNEEKSVIHYYVPRSGSRPHYALAQKNHRYGKAFVRVEDRSVQASKEWQQILKREKQPTQGFAYGTHEKTLMNYLGQHQKITLSEFLNLSNLPYRRASNILVTLAVHNVIRVIPREQEDWFVANE